jgi:hypothetical protein
LKEIQEVFDKQDSAQSSALVTEKLLPRFPPVADVED